MTTRVFACSPDETMDEARALMLRVQRKATPVVDSEGKFVGMLKFRDVMKAAQVIMYSYICYIFSLLTLRTITKKGGLACRRFRRQVRWHA